MERRGEKQCTHRVSFESCEAAVCWMAEGMRQKYPLDLLRIPAHAQSSALLWFVISAVPEPSWQ